MANSPELREFFRPRGLGEAAATAIPIPSGDMLVFSIEREYRKGPIKPAAIRRLDALRPHLARAGLVSARLHLERARAVVEALHLIGLPAAVLRDTGRLLSVNHRFDLLMPAFFQDRRDRLTLVDRNADRLLNEAFASLTQTQGSLKVCSIPIAAKEDQPPLILHILPVRGLARDIFAHGFALVVATPVIPTDVPTANVLQGLFDLTPAEARVARGIGQGHTVEMIATTAGVSRETVRNQLKCALAKTGTNRQAQLAALLSGMAPPA